MTDKEIIREIESRGWEVRTDEDTFHKKDLHQAFFRGWQTEWRGSLEQVLADVEAYQEPETANDE